MSKKRAFADLKIPGVGTISGPAEDVEAVGRELGAAATEDSGADSTQGGADVPEQEAFTAAPEEVISFSAGASVPGTAAVQIAELRAVRRAFDTLVFGCNSTRERQDAAAPAIEILDRLIGA
jgi:hypothetical protein